MYSLPGQLLSWKHTRKNDLHVFENTDISPVSVAATRHKLPNLKMSIRSGEHGCWCETSWSEYFTNGWLTGIFKTSQSSRGFKRENEHPCLCCRCWQRLQWLPVLSKQKLKMMTACLLPFGNRLARSDLRWELFMTDLKSVPSSCLARSFEFCDLQHEQSLQEQLLDDGIWGGGSNFSALHSGAGEPVISYLPLSPLLAAGYNRKGSLPCAILVPLLIIFVLSLNPWH